MIDRPRFSDAIKIERGNVGNFKEFDCNDDLGKFSRRARAQPRCSSNMPSRFQPVTISRFERRLPGGRHDVLFRVVFGSDGSAARYFQVSRMTVWRWRHDKAPLPKRVLEALPPAY